MIDLMLAKEERRWRTMRCPNMGLEEDVSCVMLYAQQEGVLPFRLVVVEVFLCFVLLYSRLFESGAVNGTKSTYNGLV